MSNPGKVGFTDEITAVKKEVKVLYFFYLWNLLSVLIITDVKHGGIVSCVIP